MPKEKRDVESGLLKKGFQLQEGDHHFYIYHYLDGRKSAIKTKTSHSLKKRTIDDHLLSHMARQCHLVRGKFIELVDCPLSQQDYEAELKKKGILR